MDKLLVLMMFMTSSIAFAGIADNLERQREISNEKPWAQKKQEFYAERERRRLIARQTEVYGCGRTLKALVGCYAAAFCTIQSALLARCVFRRYCRK